RLNQCDSAVAHGFPLISRARLSILDALRRRDIGHRVPKNVGRGIDHSVHQVRYGRGQAVLLGRLRWLSGLARSGATTKSRGGPAWTGHAIGRPALRGPTWTARDVGRPDLRGLAWTARALSGPARAGRTRLRGLELPCLSGGGGVRGTAADREGCA